MYTRVHKISTFLSIGFGRRALPRTSDRVSGRPTSVRWIMEYTRAWRGRDASDEIYRDAEADKEIRAIDDTDFRFLREWQKKIIVTRKGS